MNATVRFGALLLTAGALAACATSHPPPPTPVVGHGVYRVGKPYQVAGVWYYPREQPGYDETGIASWYGSQFHGRVTANGEVFDRNGITAAHPTLPLPSNVRVTNLDNGRSVVVRVNDRGPFKNGRIIDLSEHAADLLGFRGIGTARVRVTYLGRANLNGPGLAPSSEQTPVEVATAVPAAPTTEVSAEPLAPVAGAPTAPPAQTAELPAPQAQPVVPTPTPAAAVTGQVTEVPVPAKTSIYVQAGAFTIENNAHRVEARLHALGAKVSSIVRDGKTIVRVRIGPLQDVSAADAALSAVIAAGQNEARIVIE
jgi:rare lipoprotein A